MTRSRLYIYIIAGGYVAYTGYKLIKDAVAQRPDNYMLYLAIGILFIAIGGFFAIMSSLKVFRGDYVDSKKDSGDEPQEDTKEESDDG